MKFPLKSKLIIVFSLFVLILLSIAAVLFIREKEHELGYDIFVSSRSFAELTADDIVRNYETYLAQKGFVYFNREMRGFFLRNRDLQQVQILNYQGTLLYDSLMEKDQAYEDPPRTISDSLLKKQIQSKRLSLRTTDNRLLFLKPAENGFEYVDENDALIMPFEPMEQILYVVQPIADQYAVIYGISYGNLNERISALRGRIILLALFGILLGMVTAYAFSGRLVKPIQQLVMGSAILAKGDFSHRVKIHTRDEIETLADAFNKMAVDLDVSTKAMLDRERIKKELELAAKIQKEILPKAAPKYPSLEIVGGVLPSEEVGGDTYDYIPVNSENLITYLGDVTGHGVPSGIVVSIASAIFYLFAEKLDLKKILSEGNRILKEKMAKNMFLTLAMLHWNEPAKQLKFVSAGHEPLLHYHAKDEKITELSAKGIALGMVPDITAMLEEKTVEFFEPGDVVLVYSDGIKEAWRNEKEQYGLPRLKRALQEYATLPSVLAIRNALLADVKEFCGHYKQMDDMTLLVLKRRFV